MRYKKIESINWDKEFPKVPENVHNAISSVTNDILMKNTRVESSKENCQQKNKGNYRVTRKEDNIKENRVRHFPRKRLLILVAVITLLSGMTVVAATSMWKDRMEAMNQQEMEEYFLSITTSNAPAFRYNRAMTEAERGKFEQLTTAYENEGLFPEGALTMLDSYEEYKGKGVGYEQKSGIFFLPESELTEEQLLQIIDFYHKVDYSLATVNEQIGSGVLEELQNENGVVNQTQEGETVPEVAIAMMQDFKPINDVVSYSKLALQGEDRVIRTAASKKYLYLGFKNQIKRVPLDGGDAEVVYELNEDKAIFSISCDDADNLYVSICDWRQEGESFLYDNNQVIKVDKTGQVIVEYDVENAVTGDGDALKDTKACKMLTDDEGNLYVKCIWSSGIQIFVFDVEGKYVGMIDEPRYNCNPANGMCFGEDGYLYALTWDYIIKIDTETFEVVETYDYCTDDMIAAVDVIYPMDEDSFYICSYDGIFQYNLGEEGSTRLLAPYETDAIAEACRLAPISQDKLTITNYKDWGLEVTYLSLEGEK